MKRLISVFLSVLLVISMATAVSAADKNNNGKGNGKKNGQAVESAQTTETTPALVPAVTLEGLLKQLKENHRDKAIRKLLHNRIKEIRNDNENACSRTNISVRCIYIKKNRSEDLKKVVIHYATNYPDMLFNTSELNLTILNRIGKKREKLVNKILSC